MRRRSAIPSETLGLWPAIHHRMALWEEKKTCRATNAGSSSLRMCPRCSAASRRCSIREIIRSRLSRSRSACGPEQNVNSSKKILSSRMFFANCLYITTSGRSEEHTSELQSQSNLVCRLLLEKKKKNIKNNIVKTHITE